MFSARSHKKLLFNSANTSKINIKSPDNNSSIHNQTDRVLK